MSTDRIFLDANILFSMAYGSPGLEKLLELAKKGICELLVSRYVIEEARRNLFEPEQLKRLEGFLSHMRIIPEVDPRLECPIDLPDKDRPVLMASVSAGADYLLTGDMVHFGQYFGKTIQGTKICMARDYLKN